MKYRVKQTDVNGNRIQMTHGKLGRLVSGEVVDVPESIGERFLGTLLIRYNEPKPARRVFRKPVEQRKGTVEETE